MEIPEKSSQFFQLSNLYETYDVTNKSMTELKQTLAATAKEKASFTAKLNELTVEV